MFLEKIQFLDFNFKESGTKNLLSERLRCLSKVDWHQRGRGRGRSLESLRPALAPVRERWFAGICSTQRLLQGHFCWQLCGEGFFVEKRLCLLWDSSVSLDASAGSWLVARAAPSARMCHTPCPGILTPSSVVIALRSHIFWGVRQRSCTTQCPRSSCSPLGRCWDLNWHQLAKAAKALT